MRVALIPARGGSKRIPRKNVRRFAGKPMIAHSIGHARSSGLFDRIIVSTDDDEIARIAEEYGAEVPFRRPPELANDTASTLDVLSHAVTWLRADGADLSAVCCIYATAPLIQQEDLRAACDRIATGAWQYVFTATTYPSTIFRSFRETGGGGVEMFFPEHRGTRSQDLPEALYDAGQFYWGLPDAWARHTPIFAPTSSVIVLPHWRVQDIDTPEDWLRAEHIMSLITS